MRTAPVLPLLLASIACGGARPTTTRADSCTAYVQAVRPSLARLGRAADAFGAQVGSGPDAASAASRELAARLDEEHGKLAAVRVDGQEVSEAHAHLLAALAALADALRYLGDVVARRDEEHRGEARRRWHDAEIGWQDAIGGVKKVCPEAGLPP
jgi:hypothetical protein